MTILPISPSAIIPPEHVSITKAPDAASGAHFGDKLASSLDQLDQMQQASNESARLAATGDVASIEAHMAALTEVQLATQLTVAVRNRAVESFNEIMRMQL
jgi:flagellar hook-basal body complex protein FliE